jgi:ribosome biogenesis GTPase
VERGFPEFAPHLGRCRFRDCRHEAEPGCALREAVSDGALNARRFEHFRAIRAELEQISRR